ncbi:MULTISPECIES: HEXXH motif domain-containing protein [Pseudofrankia]|uniref:HEXXH motif domain-containing protein n=1 Tax=Pseudofrankia TaxID=2994363 RepID=UPI000234C89F|nr:MULTISPECIES: HEXXH motif domain-containing protein [Pseudofrankia]OHV36992.1 hypothetical protein BCD49_17250 [Pseudofrankia sp. EUN1h]
MVDQIAAGRPDAVSGALLRAAERNHRAVLLRAALDEARANGETAAGPLLGVDEAWDVLTAAEQADSDQVAFVIERPQVGAWAAYVLRRLRLGFPADAPLWADVGYLHAIAAAAAVRAGIHARLAVPAWLGHVPLPTLGCARGPYRDVWEPVVVGTENGAFWVAAPRWRAGPTTGRKAPPNDSGGATWRSTSWLRLGPPTDRLLIDLDDSSPHRMLAGVRARPAPTPRRTLGRWESLLDEAWELLRATDPAQASALAAATMTIVPLPGEGQFRSFSASSGDAFGAVVVSEPDDAEALAATLVHEFHHAQLGVLMHLADLVDADADSLDDQVFYAPWRDDPRPLVSLAQGTFAFYGVAGFWRRRAHQETGVQAARAYFEFALCRRRVHSALRRLRADGRIASFGARFFDGVAATVAGWLHEPVPHDLEKLAVAAARDHHDRWRIHHLLPPGELVAELADAWRAGVPAPLRPYAASRGTWYAPQATTPDPTARDLDGLAAATRIWLTDRERLRSLAARKPPGVPGAAAADLALLAGWRGQAHAAYLAELAHRRPRAGAWTGLARVLGSVRGDEDAAAGAQALRERPEVVAAVARVIATDGAPAPPPVALAAWIGRQLS